LHQVSTRNSCVPSSSPADFVEAVQRWLRTVFAKTRFANRSRQGALGEYSVIRATLQILR
jgi:hypothetical protein